MNTLDTVYVKELKEIHPLWNVTLCKREGKYSHFVYTDTYAGIKQTGIVDHNCDPIWENRA